MPANAAVYARARPRRSSSSRKRAGVPCSAASSARDVPPRCTPPPTRRAEPGQIAGSSALGSIGALERCGSGSTSPCRGPAGRAFLDNVLQPLGGAAAEQAEPVGQHDAGRVVEPRPGAVHVGDLVVALRDDPALVVPPVI